MSTLQIYSTFGDSFYIYDMIEENVKFHLILNFILGNKGCEKGRIDLESEKRDFDLTDIVTNIFDWARLCH